MLDRIEILAAVGNKRSQRVAQKLGASREGLLRNRLVIHGQAHDAVVFSLIGSEWRSPVGSAAEEQHDLEGPSAAETAEPNARMRPMNPVKGENARLELLHPKHTEGLFAIGQNEKIWRYLLRPKLESVADAQGFIEEALRVAATGSQLPFAIIDQKSNRVAGSTRYLASKRLRGGDRFHLAGERIPAHCHQQRMQVPAAAPCL